MRNTINPPLKAQCKYSVQDESVSRSVQTSVIKSVIGISVTNECKSFKTVKGGGSDGFGWLALPHKLSSL